MSLFLITGARVWNETSADVYAFFAIVSLSSVFSSVLDACHTKMEQVQVPAERLDGMRPVVEATLKAKLVDASIKIRESVANKHGIRRIRNGR